MSADEGLLAIRMNVLAINCGSTSLKFRLVEADEGVAPGGQQRRASGVVNAIGPGAQIDFVAESGANLHEIRPVDGLGVAVDLFLGGSDGFAVGDFVEQ